MGLPNVPISEIPVVGNPAFPALDSITVTDLVGPQAANRQPVSLDTRSLTLRDTLNLTVQAVNAIGAGPGGTDIFLRRDGSLGMLGHLDMASFRVTNVADPAGDSHALNRLYADGRYVRVVGDAMTGALRMANAIPVQGNDGSADRDLVKVDATPDAVFGSEDLRSIVESNGKVYRRSSGLHQIWDSGNQGPGSGLNADLVDGHEGAVIARLNVLGVQTFSGKLRSQSTSPSDAGATLVTKDYVEGFAGQYGELSGASTTLLSVQSTWYLMGGFSAGTMSGFSSSGGHTLTYNGNSRAFRCVVSLADIRANNVGPFSVQFAIYLNGSHIGKSQIAVGGVDSPISARDQAATISCLLPLSSGDSLNVRARCVNSPNCQLVVGDVNFSIY